MTDQTLRVALGNLPFPGSPEHSLELAEQAVGEAAASRAEIVCFPECFIPGYRAPGRQVPPPDRAFLEHAWARIAAAASRARVGVVLGSERLTGQGLVITALVIAPDGEIVGWQDKVQLDPTEEATYTAGSGRRIFDLGPLRFGIVICHEGWRYPETVRWAARQGAQVVFHPHFHGAEPDGYRPLTFADPANTFHEKAILCRAAENAVYVAAVNCAEAGSPTTSAVADPDGNLMCYQPYGKGGLLLADLELARATGLYAKRLRTGLS